MQWGWNKCGSFWKCVKCRDQKKVTQGGVGSGLGMDVEEGAMVVDIEYDKYKEVVADTRVLIQGSFWEINIILRLSSESVLLCFKFGSTI